MKTAPRNYLILLLLGLVFAAPGISAYFFYIHPQWLGAAPTNKGLFLDPPVLLAPLKEGASSKWRLVLWSPMSCEKNCIDQLDKLARIRLALGRRLYEVEPQLLLSADAPQLTEALAGALQEQDIQLEILPTDVRDRISVLQNSLKIFIVNPENYFVLAYQPTVKPADIFHDIKQLLNTTDKMRK